MKYRLILVLLVFCGLSVVRAQDDAAEYRLRDLTAKDYFSALPPIFEQLKSEASADEYGNKPDYRAMLEISWNEIQSKYPDWDDISYETLVDAATYFVPNTGDYYAFHRWNIAVIWAALHENKSLLSNQSQFQIHNYSFDVTKIDFNGDRVDELLLTIQSDSDTYKDYWVLQVDPLSSFGYRRVKTPELWFSTMCNFRDICGGAAQVLELRDLNADGLPEWAIAEGSYCSYGECGGNLLVLGWRNNEIVEIAKTEEFWDLGWTQSSGGGPPILPPNGGWTFENIDGDAALELVQRIPFEDNRGCEIVDNRIFDWSAPTKMYIRSKLDRVYADSTACALRGGHEAMETGDYEGSITAYEHALVLFDAQNDLDDYEREAKQYVQIRLMLAYALANRSIDALSLQANLEKQSSQSDIMQSLLDAVTVYHKQSDRIRFCKAVNAAVAQYVQTNTDYNFSIFATKDDVSGRGMLYGGGNFNSDSSGCDVGILLQQSAAKVAVNTTTAFDKGLENEGWNIITSFKADLNNDGITDWLVWTGETPYTIAFMSTGQGYKASLTFVSKPDAKTQLIIHPLNDHENPLIVELSDDTNEDDNFCGNNPPVGNISMTQWNGENLRYVGSSRLCERRTIQQLFPKPNMLQGWGSADNFSGKAVETTYTWNPTKKLFEISSEADFIPNFQDVNKSDCFGQPYGYCGFQYNDSPKIAVIILEQVIAHPDKGMSPEFLVSARYSSAIALEALNQKDEALAEYVTIYQTAPESAWGKLAALHLECVANCG